MGEESGRPGAISACSFPVGRGVSSERLTGALCHLFFFFLSKSPWALLRVSLRQITQSTISDSEGALRTYRLSEDFEKNPPPLDASPERAESVLSEAEMDNSMDRSAGRGATVIRPGGMR